MHFTTIRIVLCLALIRHVQAAFVDFTNCLDGRRSETGQRLLQFIPYNVTSFFNTTDENHLLNVTVYGTVAGQAVSGTYPPSTDPSWKDPNSTFGKITDLADGASFYTTLFSTLNVLTYTPYNANPARFCDSIIHGECPLAPAFNVSYGDIDHLTAFTVNHSMGALYAFTEIIATLKVQSGFDNGMYYSCVNVYLTPDLGDSMRDLLRYLPLGILVVVGLATISAAMFSPWGTWDIFRWTSNFGRDEDVLRLVTPGFGDCLQYLQFIVLTGSLSLNYPGFYQPVVSRIGWSSLLFNQSFVSRGDGIQPIVDGLYQYRSDSSGGLDRMTQLIGMTSPSDAWADMMVWLVIIIVSVAVLTQIGFALRWAYRQIMHVPPEDLMSKNWYFTVGNVVRIAIGYLLLPIVALSMYQFVIASLGPIYSIVLAAIVLVAIIMFAIRLIFLFARTRPRSYLFDDLQTVLAYGPLYNTYYDGAATFALIPILVNFLRGIAIGAVQASGVVQIVLLAISEVVYILSINAFRPYPSATSMNLYHTCFSVIRILTILLSIAFVPSLNVAGGSRGWIGYVILLIHACVLIFGFFLNAVQTLIEVVARLAGAGGSAGRDAARGGLAKVFGVRQLSKRSPRGNDAARQSMTSSAAILNQMGQEQRGLHLTQTRSRSISASSTMLLDNANKSPRRNSQMMALSDGQITPDASSTFSKQLYRHSGAISPGGIIGLTSQPEARDPYYRPPRRKTDDTEKQMPYGQPETAKEDPIDDRGEGASTPARLEEFEDPANELTKTKTDYAVREVDFYYGVRGPALSSGTRKLKTGPADPTGPVSSATGWFKGLLGGRKKEKTKGFEVVRSARAPPPGLMPSSEHGQDPEAEKNMETSEPYRDLPLGHENVTRRDDDDASTSSEHDAYVSDIPARPPFLPLIDTGGAIELPSRAGSESSKRWKRSKNNDDIPAVPSIPRRSSKRTSSQDMTDIVPPSMTSVAQSPQSSPRAQQSSLSALSNRIPFTSAQNAPSKHRHSTRGNSTTSSFDQTNLDQENQVPITTTTVEPAYAHLRHSNSTLGAHIDGDRPSSVGFVREHRASDGIIHQAGGPSNYEGSIAEIHGTDSARRSQLSEDLSRRTSSINPYGQPGQRASRFRD